jgi:hypothetical protein
MSIAIFIVCFALGFVTGCAVTMWLVEDLLVPRPGKRG